MPRVRPVLLCAAVSISLHAAVLAYRVTPSSSPSSTAAAHGNDGGTASRATRIRVVPKRLPAVSGSDEIVKKPRQEQPQVERSAAPSRPFAGAPASAAPARPHTPAPGTPPQPAIEQAALDSMPEVRSQAVETASSSPDGFDGSDYIPRSLLSAPPSALMPIVLDAPEGAFAAGRYVGVLSIFIDEEGRVRHVDVAEEGSTLPPPFEQVAREAFSAALFSPGQMDGRTVKSRQRVEVVFDNTPAGHGGK
ncbi:energy transducer TonB [Variovorax paradoxus]|nr:hypothetical protein [Variovorax paradoxus]